MKKVGLLLATCVILLFAANGTALGQKFIVEPGVVRHTQTVGLDLPRKLPLPYITGSITLKESQLGADTSQTGGGCLIYYSPGHRECTNNDGCTLHTATRNPDGSLSQSRVGIFGYCAYTVNINDLRFTTVAKKGCWYKPEPESCVRRPDPNHPLPLDQPLEFDNWTRIHPPGVKGRISWRVVSCQNLKPGGCGGLIPNGFQHRYGLITEFQ